LVIIVREKCGLPHHINYFCSPTSLSDFYNSCKGKHFSFSTIAPMKHKLLLALPKQASVQYKGFPEGLRRYRI